MNDKTPKEIDRATAQRHKRGFEALRQSLRDLADTPELDTAEQLQEYLKTVPADLRPKIRAIFDDIAKFLAERKFDDCKTNTDGAAVHHTDARE